MPRPDRSHHRGDRGYEDAAPIPSQARAALERYLRTHPRVGDVWMFPQPHHPDRPTTIMLARRLRIRAEKLAGLPHIDRGGFHAYRRLFAVERKHMPGVDLMRAGGWRDLATLKRFYQQADPATTLRVIENAPETGSSGHTSDTLQKASEGRSTA
jgi:integrase